jgi:hypothetical protein
MGRWENLPYSFFWESTMRCLFRVEKVDQAIEKAWSATLDCMWHIQSAIEYALMRESDWSVQEKVVIVNALLTRCQRSANIMNGKRPL